MEQLLNSVWVAVAAAAFVVAVPRALWRDAQRHPVRKVLLALVCALALLFPIISVSDDLRLDNQALEEWTGGKHVRLTVANASHQLVSASGTDVPIALSAVVALAFGLVLLARLQTAGAPTHVAFSADRANPRSPPTAQGVVLPLAFPDAS
jgi:hypothetical protein